MIKMALEIIDRIKRARNILVSRHINADGDCIGSQYGMYWFIKKHFPEKVVHCDGSAPSHYLLDLFPEEANKKVVKKKWDLQIIVDTSAKTRLDGNVISEDKIIVIDHHTKDDIVGSIELRDIKASSTCELAANLCIELENHDPKYTMDRQIATAFFIGILTDTKRFWYNFTPNLLETTKELLKYDIDVKYLYEQIFYWDLNEIRFRNKFIEKAEIDGDVIQVIVEKDEYADLGIDYQTAKELALSLIEIKQVKYILVAVKYEDIYSVSLRSKDKRIDNIAKKYGGGGHRNASGVRVKDKEEISHILDDLRLISIKSAP